MFEFWISSCFESADFMLFFIFVRKGQKMHTFVDWSKPLAQPRRTCFPLVRRMRPPPPPLPPPPPPSPVPMPMMQPPPPQFFHRQNYWRPPHPNPNKFHRNYPRNGGVNFNHTSNFGGGTGCGRSNGPGILWELNKVDRQIQSVQSEIVVLKQQLKIAQTYCVAAPPPPSVPPSPNIAAQSTKQCDPLEYCPRYLATAELLLVWLKFKQNSFSLHFLLGMDLLHVRMCLCMFQLKFVCDENQCTCCCGCCW